MSQNVFLKRGNSFHPTPKAELDLHDALPALTFAVKYNERQDQYWLETIEDFTLPSKLYGNTSSMADRILRTYNDRSGTTGVLLAGEKGSGKTLLAKQVSREAAALEGIPTVIVTQQFAGETFNTFLQMLGEAVVIFDEFEKVYDKAHQQALLTLLDGVYSSKKLFILTCNDSYAINSHMVNRPGRLYYRLTYDGLSDEFIREYCADVLVNQEHTEALCRVASIFSAFNFDMLKAIVEEMNRFEESPSEAMSVLNARPEFSDAVMYDVALVDQGKEVERKRLNDYQWSGNPLMSPASIDFERVGDEHNPEWRSARFSPNDLKSIDPKRGSFEYTNEEGQRLSLTRKKAKTYVYSGLY